MAEMFRERSIWSQGALRSHLLAKGIPSEAVDKAALLLSYTFLQVFLKP